MKSYQCLVIVLTAFFERGHAEGFNGISASTQVYREIYTNIVVVHVLG